jgi:elongation factor P
MVSTSDFRKGLKVEHDSKPYIMVDFQHVNPGKGAAFCRTKLKNLETGQVLEVTYKSGDMVPTPELEYREMQYLYSDGESFTFMDNANYEQVSLSEKELGDNRYFVIENSNVKVTYYKNRAVAVEVDNFVNLTVAETQPNIKGDTTGGGGKPATMQTGLVVTVPFHISVGDILKIDTRSSKYVEKVKS